MSDLDLVAILERAVARAGSKQAVATALRRSHQWLGRVLSRQTKVGPAVCVRIARLEHLPVLDTLRAAGHTELAAELEAAGFGAEAVSHDDLAILRALNAMPRERRAHFVALILDDSSRKRERKR